MKRAICILLLSAAWLFAENPSVIAIRNARIVTVSGPALANGTVVVRNGLIEAVGENVAVPADAWVIDGKGLTVYPGLIDALSTVGIEAPAPANNGGGRGNAAAAFLQASSGPYATGPEDRPQTTSWEHAAELVKPSERRIETFRSG